MTAALLLFAGSLCRAQTATSPAHEPAPEKTIEAGGADAEAPKRKLVHWNEYEGPYFTIRMGGGLLLEYDAYAQDEESKQQFALHPEARVRDFRFLLKGRFPRFKRSVTWCAGIMYNGASSSWLMRETGVMFELPEWWGYLFVGRTKEGFSLNKVMSGYSNWTLERSTMSDATIPILGDGVKWLGYVPRRHLLWNVGYYLDYINEDQSFSSYDNQAVARVAWLPLDSEDSGTLLHLGINTRYGNVDQGELQIRSRPEAFTAPYFLDTGEFPADKTKMAGIELYYRPGPWLFGTEYWFQDVSSNATGNPLFQGGEAVATWLITGETRGYTTTGGYFKSVSPARTVFEGGPGAWEAVLRFSYTNLDSGSLEGGKFWRVTPMVNWYLSDNLRLELAYGYGRLDRFDLLGDTQFFQVRLQMVL